MEKKNIPEISVIMPSYNAEKFIEEAIRSVLKQSFGDFELIVIDDGSKDSTCEIVENLAKEDERIIFLKNEHNMGVAKTRNRGFELCRGKYVALLDSDDVWHPEKLEKQLGRIEETGAEISYCSYGIITEKGEKVRADYIVSEETTFEKLLKENVIGCSTVVLSSDLIKEHRFNPDFYHEDYVLWLQLLKSGYTAAGCKEVLADWRYLENSRSFNKRNGAHNRWKIYREYLGLPFFKSVWVFINYAAAGIKKYMSK